MEMLAIVNKCNDPIWATVWPLMPVFSFFLKSDRVGNDNVPSFNGQSQEA